MTAFSNELVLPYFFPAHRPCMNFLLHFHFLTALILGLTMTEVIAISAGSVVGILLLIVFCCCCCICCCCCKDDEEEEEENGHVGSAGHVDQNSETESQRLDNDAIDPHQYWVLPSPVRRVQRRVSRRVTRSFRDFRTRYYGGTSDEENRTSQRGRSNEMVHLGMRNAVNPDDKNIAGPNTLERQRIAIDSDEDFEL